MIGYKAILGTIAVVTALIGCVPPCMCTGRYSFWETRLREAAENGIEV